MQYVKILGLTAVGVVAILIIAGGSSASATVLCKTTPEEGSPATKGTVCASSWAHPAGTTIHGVNSGVVAWHTSFKTIECKKSTIQLKTENEGSASETVKGPVEVLTFEECNCEVKVLKNGTLEIHWISDTFNGTLTGSGQEITVICNTIFGNVHCIYVTSNQHMGEIAGSVKHDLDATINGNVSFARVSTNALCDEEALWTVTYDLKSPKPLWIAGHT